MNSKYSESLVCLYVFVQAVHQNTIEVMERMIDQREHKLEDLKESAAKYQVRTVQNVQICITIITSLNQGSLTTLSKSNKVKQCCIMHIISHIILNQEAILCFQLSFFHNPKTCTGEMEALN